MQTINPEPYLETLPGLLSPLGIIGISLVLCTATLGFCSIFVVRHHVFAFMWVVHSFLGFFGMFALMAIFCPNAMLSFDQRVKLLSESNCQVNDNPWVVLVATFGGLGFYMFSWYKKRPQSLSNNVQASRPDPTNPSDGLNSNA